MQLDHVVVGVRDLDVAAERFSAEFGLSVAGGGEHPSWGTRNALIPVGGGQYIELLAVVDASVEHPLPRMLSAMVADGDRPIAVCLRPPDLARTAARLGLTVTDAERVGSDGASVRWRMAGLDRALGGERLPFFIDWGEAGPFDSLVSGSGGPEGCSWVELSGDPEKLTTWIGGEPDWLRLTPGEPGVQRVAVALGDDEVLIR